MYSCVQFTFATSLKIVSTECMFKEHSEFEVFRICPQNFHSVSMLNLVCVALEYGRTGLGHAIILLPKISDNNSDKILLVAILSTLSRINLYFGW